jgi:hypothetical protein
MQNILNCFLVGAAGAGANAAGAAAAAAAEMATGFKHK